MPKPIFLHSGWRSGSTYLWNKFRRIDRFVAFYEPFNEILASVTAERARTLSTLSWSGSNHPELDRPYFAEYGPLIDVAGVRGYRESFALTNYFRNDTDLEDQHDYLSGLLDHAASVGKVAVLGFVRSVGRVRWLRRRFDAVHILLIRDPVQQWASGHLQRIHHGNPYFHLMPYMILGQAPECAARVGARAIAQDEPLGQRFSRHLDAFGADPPGESLRVFLHYHLATHLAACDGCDLVVDIDLLSQDPVYRAQIETELDALTDTRFDFSDAHVGRHDLGALGMRLTRTLDEFLRLHAAPHARERARRADTSRAAGTIMDKMSASLLAAALECGVPSSGAADQARASCDPGDCVEALASALNEIQTRRTELEFADAHVAALQQKAAALEQGLAAIHASSSWRITAPLRALAEAARNLTRRSDDR
ncbi:MAG: hypothetical protein EPO27_14120 [Betaproteobacteria bacterium]|nr:MAG: hypothetical protein EPO27_14120 [Betaproteobacteria bacterium]